MALSYLAFLVFALFALFPIGEAALWAFHSKPRAIPPALPSLTSATLFDAATWQWCARTALTAFAVAIAGIALASVLGYFFSRLRLRPCSDALYRSPLPQIVPALILLAPLAFLLWKLGQAKSCLWVGVIFLLTALPFSSWQLKRRYDAISPAVEEAATIDGCTAWQKYYLILWPTIAPALCWTAFFSFASAWNICLVAGLLLWDANLFPLPHAWGLFRMDAGAQWALYAAGVFAASLVLACFFFLFGRSSNSEAMDVP
ncbi:MAG: ABC transporter permease subunit [Chthoniobacterales bacterium]|nr:ABC transporter permease subunit [Chthoniobacterales bacterium]